MWVWALIDSQWLKSFLKVSWITFKTISMSKLAQRYSYKTVIVWQNN